jgi:metal-responsive CopG/Arc/MetJ family transcriptional regulator
MKEKTSITLSKDVLAKVDRLAGSKHSRSSFIESVLRKYLLERAHAAVRARDLERINAAADRLNAEAAEAMEYQVSVK